MVQLPSTQPMVALPAYQMAAALCVPLSVPKLMVLALLFTEMGLVALCSAVVRMKSSARLEKSMTALALATTGRLMLLALAVAVTGAMMAQPRPVEVTVAV
jgi:hypothetical protein